MSSFHVHLHIGDATLPATLDDTPIAHDFARLLPLELTLSDYGATEKVADLPRPLDTTDAPPAYAAARGDLTYYAPWGNLAVFYRPFRSAGGLARLGQFDGDLGPLEQAGPLRVRIERAAPPH